MEQGREDVVMQIRDYVLGTSHKPLVLHGLSGCGKTSLMAKAASQVRHYTGTGVAKAASQVIKTLHWYSCGQGSQPGKRLHWYRCSHGSQPGN